MVTNGQAADKVNKAKGTQMPLSNLFILAIRSILSVNLSITEVLESIGVKMKSWIAESDFLFRDARVPRRQP